MSGWLLKGSPLSVQAEALRLSEGRKGYLYLMEQGLGKTGVILADFLRLKAEGKVDLLMVVCPNSLKSNWEDEALAWESGLAFTLWPFKPETIHLVKDAVVFNYESLSAGSVREGRKSVIKPGRGGEAALRLMQTRRVYLALDESHRIKNPSSNLTKFVLGQLMKDAVVRRGGTGTPYGNSVVDLYPQLRLAGELQGVSHVLFKRRYAELGGFMGKKVVGIDESNKDGLFRLIDDNGFRALKSDWTDIPDKLYKSLRVEMTPKISAAYREMKSDFCLMLNDEDVVSAAMIVTQMQKLQQISSGFIRTEEGDRHVIEPLASTPKFKALADVLDANGATSKTLVFAHFSFTIQALREALYDLMSGVPAAYIVGGMTAENIREQKASFNQDGGPTVMVIQSQAGKEGHTLLGGPNVPCHTSVFFENTYDMIVRKQCEDRNHRHGQRNPVQVIDLVSSPVEAAAVAALQEKSDLAQKILDLRGTF